MEKDKVQELLSVAYLEGFMASAEGWNGERPHNFNRVKAWESGVGQQFVNWLPQGLAMLEQKEKEVVKQQETGDIRSIMREIAAGLKENGCTDEYVKLALLAWCGVPVEPLRVFELRISG